MPKRRHGQRNSTSADTIAVVRQLVLIANDELSAGLLNRNGLKTGNGKRWTRTLSVPLSMASPSLQNSTFSKTVSEQDSMPCENGSALLTLVKLRLS